jgi:Ca-activated chloride channel family protein
MHAGLVRVLVPVSLLVVASSLSDRHVASNMAGRQPVKGVVIRGTISDSATSSPVAEATVTITGTQLGARSGQDGGYRLVLPDSIALGRDVTLRVRRIGYAAGVRVIHPTSDTITVNVALAQSQLQLQEVVVTGTAARSERRTSGSSVATVQQAPAPSSIAIRGAASIATAAPAPGPRPTTAASYAGAKDEKRSGFREADPDFNTEGYDAIAENPFLTTAWAPRSTFSIDVDHASYSNVRRFVRNGQRPPRDAVRLEELINYFPYEQAAPKGDDPVSIMTEVGVAPWNPTHRIVRVGLRGRPITDDALPPNNLVFLIDVSGSMMSADKLPLLKSAFQLLVNELRPQDRVALVVYAGQAGVVLPSTPGSQKEVILEAIERLEAGGSTAGGAGIRLAYDVAKQNFMPQGNNRVILATDGDFNVGTSSDAELVQLIEERREHGTFLTVLGFGTGNVKDSKMEKLADKGNGNYAYVDDINEARKVLVTEMGGTLVTVAKDVKLQIEFNPTRVGAYRLLGYENRLLRDEDFKDDRKDAGELGAGLNVTALYELIPPNARDLADVPRPDSMRYTRVPVQTSAAGGSELMYVKLRYKTPTGMRSREMTHAVPDVVSGTPSADFVFASAVAEFGMVLRDSPHKGRSSMDSVVVRAERSRGEDENGYRAEFVRLATAARDLLAREQVADRDGSRQKRDR